jgi:anti-anti-sigma factor
VFPRITLDLSRVTFMDCAGVSTLLEGERRSRAGGSRLDIVAVSRAACRMIAAGRRARPYPPGALELPRRIG